MLAALHLTEPRTAGLAELTEADWRKTIEWAHQGMLGLALRRAARDRLPAWAREELDGCALRNSARVERIRGLYAEIQRRLGAAGIEFLALKGIAQCPLFTALPEDRPQYDIDLYVAPAQAQAANRVFLDWGFQPIKGMDDFPTDHLPALIRKTGWEWRGDYFDLDLPLPIEIHVQFWNAKLERLAAPGIEQFWERRVTRTIDGMALPVLAEADALGYASLHLLKHVLHGSVRPFHGYEVAGFFQRRMDDEPLWREWSATHSPQLRRLEAAGFALAQRWFGCELPPAVREEMECLPEGAQAWFEEFAASPVVRPFYGNKDELWLHLSLLESQRDAWRVARRRLFPIQIPGPVDAVFLPPEQLTLRRRILKQTRLAMFAAGRLRLHAVALPRAIATGARWWLGAEFWMLLASGALFNFALFVFVLLYNLYLLDLGYREDFLGAVASASTIGTMAGTLPAAWLAHRIGLRRALLGCLTGAAVLMLARSLAQAPATLVALAFTWGLTFSIWAVVFAPAIASLVPEKRRATAFSVFFASMIGVGVAGNWVGGRLPFWMGGKRAALALASALVLAALVPAWRLKLQTGAPQPGRIYPRSRFLVRYLAAYAVWQVAMGAFNPFGSVYFARLKFSTASIGNLFSTTQVTQAGAILLAPAVLRRAGLVRGIAWMMAATALGLGGLSIGPGAGVAMVAYAWYMSAQWMSEPGMSTLLMDQVAERERGGAASLNYLVAFAAQAGASYGAGRLLALGHYGMVLAGAGALALVAAAMFRFLVGGG